MHKYRKNGNTEYFVVKGMSIHNPFMEINGGDILTEDPIYYWVKQGVPAPLARQTVGYHRMMMREALCLADIALKLEWGTKEQIDAENRFFEICEEVTDADTFEDFDAENFKATYDERIKAGIVLIHLGHVKGKVTIHTLVEQGIHATYDDINDMFNYYDRTDNVELRPNDKKLQENEKEATPEQAEWIRAFIYTNQTVPTLMGYATITDSLPDPVDYRGEDHYEDSE